MFLKMIIICKITSSDVLRENNCHRLCYCTMEPESIASEATDVKIEMEKDLQSSSPAQSDSVADTDKHQDPSNPSPVDSPSDINLQLSSNNVEEQMDVDVLPTEVKVSPEENVMSSIIDEAIVSEDVSKLPIDTPSIETQVSQEGNVISSIIDETIVSEDMPKLPVEDTPIEAEVSQEGNVMSSITDEAIVSEGMSELPVEDTPIEMEVSQEGNVMSSITDEAIVSEGMSELPVKAPPIETEVSQGGNVVSIIGEAIESEGLSKLPTDEIVNSTSENINTTDLTVPIEEPVTVNKEDVTSLSQNINTDESISVDTNLLPGDNLNEEQFPSNTSTDILQEASKNIQPNKWKPKSGSFSLGVPGLTFSAQNLKIANDGTKMVQIHQSQITPSQLEALQANPNIKVVFRHIPSGKSFTKPPKNLFSSQTRGSGIKRKNQEEEKGIDDSIYNFDDEFDAEFSYSEQPKSKVPNTGNGNAKYARYNPNVGMKKRPGRPRLIPETGNMAGPMHSRPVLPTQIQLTDALVKLNKPGATHTVKVHVKQVTHDILINMELNPKYNIVLTAKHEVPPNHSLEELVKEWEEKETIDQPQQQNVTEEASPSVEIHKCDEEKEKELIKEQERKKEEKKIKREKVEEKPLHHQKWRQQQKEKEEAELLSAALLEKTSRSGRIRKPSRFSLDIARMTKRRIIPGDTSPDEESFSSPKPPKRPIPKTPQSDSTSGDANKKRGRGRPKKIKKNEVDTTSDDTPSKVSLDERSPTTVSIVPRVMMSPTDKRLADILLEENNQLLKKEQQFLSETGQTQKDDTKSVTESSEEIESNIIKPSDVESNKSMEETQENVEEKLDTEDSNQSGETANVAVEENDTDVKTTEIKEDDNSLKSPDSGDVAGTETSNETTCKNIETDKSETNTNENVTENNTPITKDNESPSDILARKLSKEGDNSNATTDDVVPKPTETTLKDFVEEEGDVDNKYRLRKLLQQCSIEEIKSVAIPRALDIISLGDFFLHKAGQMCSKKVSFNSLYSQLEDLHTCVEKESIRYSTLLRRANKVGGDRRMEKVILMPIYNKQAAESLHINSSSIDAHIGSIYPKPTTNMIAASSFHMNYKMESPLRRLNLPELTDRTLGRKKRGGAVYSQPGKYTAKPTTTGVDSSHVQRPYTAGRPRGSWKRSYQVRKPNYLLGDESNSSSATSLQEHARIQLANRYRAQLVAKESVAAAAASNLVSNRQTASVAKHTTPGDIITSLSTATETTAQLNSTSAAEITTETSELPPGTELVTEDGATIMAAEDGKQLVSIGDGQYVELPEGYTLIQTDEGYLIGQAGATFVQGDDGSVYMTSTVEGTELTDQQVLTTTATISDQQSSEQILEQLTQG